MAEDERRVEPRCLLVGSGAGTTPERIAEIEHRALKLERIGRAKPSRSFAEVLGKRKADSSEQQQEELSLKEVRRRALPRKGPRPSLVHPAHREVFGRNDEKRDPVVLKA